MTTSHDLRCKVLKTAADLFRSSGPCVKDEVRHELFVQTVGVDAENVDEVTDFVWKLLIDRRVIEKYDDVEGAYDIREVRDRA